MRCTISTDDMYAVPSAAILWSILALTLSVNGPDAFHCTTMNGGDLEGDSVTENIEGSSSSAVVKGKVSRIDRWCIVAVTGTADGPGISISQSSILFRKDPPDRMSSIFASVESSMGASKNDELNTVVNKSFNTACAFSSYHQL
jgi:hypothetical protein